MTCTVDYYFAPQSPWAYLGHARFASMAQETNATVRVQPVDLGRVFPVSGGLPLGKRAPQRQAYRLMELQRFSDYLQVPLNLQPLHFPVAGDDASRLIVATDAQCGSAQAMKLAGAVMAAVWVQERNIADETVLAQLLQECALAPDLLVQSHSQVVQECYEAHTQAAIEAGVFGAPSYVIDGEIFWGQDRLAFVQRKLLAA